MSHLVCVITLLATPAFTQVFGTVDQSASQASQASVFIGGQHHTNPLKPHSFFIWPYSLTKYLTTSYAAFVLRASVDLSGPTGTAQYNYYDIGLYCLQGECANSTDPYCGNLTGCAGQRYVHTGLWPYTRVASAAGAMIRIPWINNVSVTLPPGLYAVAVQDASWGTTQDSAHVAGDATGSPPAGPIRLFSDWWGQNTQPSWPDYNQIFTDPPRVKIAASGGDSSSVSIQIASNILTVTLNNGTFTNFAPGDLVQFEALANASFLNDQPPVNVLTATSATLTAAVPFGDYGPTNETTQGAITNVTESKGGLPASISLTWANPCLTTTKGTNNNFFCYGPGLNGKAGTLKMLPPHAANFFFY